MYPIDRPEFLPLGDSAVVVRLGQEIEPASQRSVRQFMRALEADSVPGLIECVPAFTSVTVFYNALDTSYENLVHHLQRVHQQSVEEISEAPKVVEVPVCYGGAYGPDLAFVAEHNGLSESEVIRIHASAPYLVYMIGFAPGFPYLGGVPPTIATPRRKSPRLSIPPGSVGIAGTQTGVYPISTPGGWQLIGRTPLSLFQPQHNPPTLLNSGDLVQFLPISKAQYERWEVHTPS